MHHPIIFATDLVSFTRCRHITTLKRQGIQGANRAEDGEMYARKGMEHEKQFRAMLSHCVEVPQSEAPQRKAELTREYMRRGSPWIYHGWLIDGRFEGEVDFLKRVDVPCPALGAYSYQVVDTKLGLSLKPEHVLQLCHYSDLLGKHQGLLPRFATVVSGDGKEHNFDVSEYIHYFRNLREVYLRFRDDMAPTRPYPVAHCELCSFREHCFTELRAQDHVSLTLGIRKAAVTALETMQVLTIRQLSELDPQQFVRARGLTRDGFLLLRQQAGAQAQGRIIVRNPALLSSLPPPASGDIFFDMESDPMAGPEGLEYLFGLWVRESGEKDRFVPFWGLNVEEEKLALERTIDFFRSFREKHPEMHIYHYGSYEPAHLVDLACRHATREAELDELLSSETFVNLHAVVRKSLWLPVESLSLKVLEPLFGFHRDGEVKAAGSSIVYFEKWLESKDPALLEAIERYNEADVQATALLYDWLRGLA